MLQQDVAEDYVIATGRQYSVRDFVAAAGALLDMKIEWQGDGIDEVGTDAVSGKVRVRVDPRYFRPTEVETLLGDPSKAKQNLGWVAETSFAELVEEMVECDLALARRDALVAKEGYQVYSHHE
jgi:GDPmannose 4,6-dehydratase